MPTISGCMSVRMISKEISMWISSLSKEDPAPPCGRASAPLKAWKSKEVEEGGMSSLPGLGHTSSSTLERWHPWFSGCRTQTINYTISPPWCPDFWVQTKLHPCFLGSEAYRGRMVGLLGLHNHVSRFLLNLPTYFCTYPMGSDSLENPD